MALTSILHIQFDYVLLYLLQKRAVKYFLIFKLVSRRSVLLLNNKNDYLNL